MDKLTSTYLTVLWLSFVCSGGLVGCGYCCININSNRIICSLQWPR